MSDITLIAAVSSNGVIGKNGKLPWKLNTDMQLFRANTLGKTVVMGRKTFESIGRPLSGRNNIVFSNNLSEGGNYQLVSSVDEALAAKAPEQELMVIGGAQIYALFLPIATKMILTEVDVVLDGDVMFPPFNKDEWVISHRFRKEADAHDEYSFTVVTYGRKSS